MKQIISTGLVCMLLLVSECSGAAHEKVTDRDTLTNKNILIVYLSRTKNTRALAGIIHENVGGKLVELVLENPYPENYQANVDQVARENSNGYLPPLKTKIADMDKYDLVFVGFPTWGMQLPPPMKSFLKQYNFKGKTIIPFNTNAGYGVGSSFETIKMLCPDSKIEEGFSMQGGKEKEGVLFVMEGKRKTEAQAKLKLWLKKIKAVQ